MRWLNLLLMSVALVPAVAFAQATQAPTVNDASGDRTQTPSAQAPKATERQGSSSTQAEPTTLGVIVVTAQHREQQLRDVPLSVSVVPNSEIESRGATSLGDLQYSIPGLSIVGYGSGPQYIQLRGVSSTVGAPTVGVYLDQMPITSDVQGGALDVRLLDMKRVEVLRGPQATLYGQDSMGGTIRYITADPDLNAFSGSMEAEYGSVTDGGASYQATGVLNLPIVKDRFGARVVAGYQKLGGFIDDSTTGKDDVNGATVKTFRAKLLARPTDQLDLSLLALHQEGDQDYQNFGVDRVTNAVLPSFNHDHYDLANAVVRYYFESATLLGSVGYLDRHVTGQYDVTPFYAPVLAALFGLPPGSINQVGLVSDTPTKTYSAQLRLSSVGDDPFGWIVGARYRDMRTDATATTFTAPLTLPITVLDTVEARSSKSYSVFTDLTYRLAPQLTLIAGLRYYMDTRTFDSSSINFGVPALDFGKDTFHALTPRVDLRYELSPGSMVYASAAKGFRSGGFNLTSAGLGIYPIPPSYDPDNIWTYEIGTKQQFLGGKLFFDGAVYYSDWKDVQSDTYATGSPIIIITNSGHVSGWGTDLSVTAIPAEGLTLSASYSWNNLAYDTATAGKAPGDPVDFAVQRSYSASVDYRRPVFGNTKGFFRVDYQHAGRSQITLRNFATGQVIDRPARDLVNLHLGLAFEQFEVSLFANNLLDEDAPLIVGPFGVVLENVEQRPRTIGINVRTKF